MHQLELITDLLGTPSAEVIAKASRLALEQVPILVKRLVLTDCSLQAQ